MVVRLYAVAGNINIYLYFHPVFVLLQIFTPVDRFYSDSQWLIFTSMWRKEFWHNEKIPPIFLLVTSCLIACYWCRARAMARTAGMLNRSPSLKNKRAYLKRMFEVEEAIPRNYINLWCQSPVRTKLFPLHSCKRRIEDFRRLGTVNFSKLPVKYIRWRNWGEEDK